MLKKSFALIAPILLVASAAGATETTGSKTFTIKSRCQGIGEPGAELTGLVVTGKGDRSTIANGAPGSDAGVPVKGTIAVLKLKDGGRQSSHTQRVSLTQVEVEGFAHSGQESGADGKIYLVLSPSKGQKPQKGLSYVKEIVVGVDSSRGSSIKGGRNDVRPLDCRTTEFSVKTDVRASGQE